MNGTKIKNKIRKFKCVLKGFFFGIISTVALTSCLYLICNQASSSRSVICILFGISLLSLGLGFIGILHDNRCYRLKQQERII